MTTSVVTWEADSEPIGRGVVAVGVFDGVHVGHQALVAYAVVRARDQDTQSVVLTFDRDPDQVVTPDCAAPQLLTLEDKIRFISDLAVDTVLVVPFCVKLAETEPERFLDDVLTEAVDPVAVVVGSDFRFGHRASGDVDTLASYGKRHGFEVIAHELVLHDGEPVTSTRIRNLISSGRVEDAAVLLGRSHRINGRVVRGRGEGASVIGIPTANISPGLHSALPARGVYAGRGHVGPGSWPAAISVGIPPTFPDSHDILEAHLAGFSGELYGNDITLEFFTRLRDQRSFSTAEELARQMSMDISTAVDIEGQR